METMEVELSKKGYPVLWERGGSYSNTGDATCIANKNGEPKKPLFVRTGGHLACSEHALFILDEGDVWCRVSRHRNDINIYLWRVVKVEQGNHNISIERIGTYHQGEWDIENPEFCYQALIDATVKKSYDYHCRTPYFIIQN